MKQIFYVIAIIVLMYFAHRVMAKVKDYPEPEDHVVDEVEDDYEEDVEENEEQKDDNLPDEKAN